MAISRYESLNIVRDEQSGKRRIGMFPPIFADDLKDDENDVFIEFTDGDRLDALAANYFGDGRYWWVICLLNDISLPFGSTITPGTILRMPTNVNKILSIIEGRRNIV